MAFSMSLFSFNRLPQYPIPQTQISLTQPIQFQTPKKWANVHDHQTLDKIVNPRFRRLKEAGIELHKATDNESLKIIDILQRFGIDYHFHHEIQEILQNRCLISTSTIQNHSLSQVSLQFRLLRQQGFYVPSDVFSSFTNKYGKFKSELCDDIPGLIGLYEASQLRIGGEYILDEAEIFSSHILDGLTRRLYYEEAKIISSTLNHPFHRTLTRPLIKTSLRNFQPTNEVDQLLMDLAKFDFNTVQSFNKENMSRILQWWNELCETANLKLYRDEPLERFMWPLACFVDPSSSKQRIELGKIVSLLLLTHNVFDLGGSVDQLSLFTRAVHRWEMDAGNDLPGHLKICFTVLYKVTNEIGLKMNNGYDPIHSLQKAWAQHCEALLEEAKWVAIGKWPKAEEYLKIASKKCGVNVVLTCILHLTTQTINFVNEDNMCGILSSVAKIHCLWNELSSEKDEDKYGARRSYMKCYMIENGGISEEDAKKHIISEISNTWKQLNEQCLSPNSFLGSFTKAALNIARLATFMYSNYSYENMKSLVYECIL